MPVLYINPDKHDSLGREPYASFIKSFNLIKGGLDGEHIELCLREKEGDADEMSFVSSGLRIDFADSPGIGENKPAAFVRVCYHYEGEDETDLELYLQRIKDINRAVPYLYIPNVTHLDFSSQIDGEYRLNFDVLVDDVSNICGVCCTLISHFIAFFSIGV